MKVLIHIGLYLKGRMKFFRRQFVQKLTTFLSAFPLALKLNGQKGNKKMMQLKSIKKVKLFFKATERHWVGDGFYVHGMLRPSKDLLPLISPFILMDYASPKTFSPRNLAENKPRGVGTHPHRGFETVTFAFQGEIKHQDSSGGGGIIESGDVQWMTAGSGIVHNEFHSENFSKEGGIFEMVQLWVNLPKKNKMSPPKYQGLKKKNMPTVQLGEGASLRIIAGEFNYDSKKYKGPANTFTPINIYSIFRNVEPIESSAVLPVNKNIELQFLEKTNTILLILEGEITMTDEYQQVQRYTTNQIIIFDQVGEYIEFQITDKFKALVLNGEPINEPVVAHGPFVMNTQKEIKEAIADYQNGKMGTL